MARIGNRVTCWPSRVPPAAAAIAEVKMNRSRIPATKLDDVAMNTRPATRSRCRFQSSWATGPPIE